MFMFLTRTKNTDYRLREGDGQDSEAEGFTGILRGAGITGTEKPCAVLKDDVVVAAGMTTGSKDIHGRQIRFSFSLEDDEAGKVFGHLVNCWSDAEEVMRTCLDITEDSACFDAERFTEWLKDYADEAPLPGNFVKWEKSSGDVTPFTLPAKTRNRKTLIAAVLAVVAGIAFFAVDGNDADEEQKLQREAVRAGISRMFSELGLLSGDIHIKLLEAEGEYQDAFDEIASISGGNMTSSDVKRLAELVPLRDSAKLKLLKLSEDINALDGIYALLGRASEDAETKPDEAIALTAQAEGEIARLNAKE